MFSNLLVHATGVTQTGLREPFNFHRALGVCVSSMDSQEKNRVCKNMHALIFVLKILELGLYNYLLENKISCIPTCMGNLLKIVNKKT